MIIPVKCFTCGKVIGNKYRWYLRQLKARTDAADQDPNFPTMIYLTNAKTEKTISGQLLDELNLTRMCCRRHMLAHIDM